MHVLTKKQILGLVEALSKLTPRKINKAYVHEEEDFAQPKFEKVKFIGFTNESFEERVEAIYSCNYKTRLGKAKELKVKIGWNMGNFMATKL